MGLLDRGRPALAGRGSRVAEWRFNSQEDQQRQFGRLTSKGKGVCARDDALDEDSSCEDKTFKNAPVRFGLMAEGIRL